jgi:hypothetical protein
MAIRRISMKIYVLVNEDGFIDSYFLDPQPMAIEITLEDGFDISKLQYCKYENGKLIYSQERESALKEQEAKDKSQCATKQEIESLKAELTETDYKIIKCSEYQLAGLELPYDIATLHAERQALRDRINELEAALS